MRFLGRLPWVWGGRRDAGANTLLVLIAALTLAGAAALIGPRATTMTLAGWAWSGLVAVLGFCAAVKGLTERLTRRWLAWRKARRIRLTLAT